jgi:hypothetical protein
MSIRTTLWSLRRSLGLSPTQRVFRELERRGVRLKELVALELFAHCGFLHTRDYHPLVARLEAWEIDPRQEAALRRNLPGAVIQITDSYREIKRTPGRYSLIVVDAPGEAHGPNGEHWEHFDILPDVFRVATDSAVIIVNVMPGPDGRRAGRRPPLAAAHLERRRAFYGTDHPGRIPFEHMIPAYRRLIEANGFELEWYFSRCRTLNGRFHYLVLKIKRRAAG